MALAGRWRGLGSAALVLGLWLAAGPAAAQDWEVISPVARPAAREGAALVYDPLREHLLLFGGDGMDIMSDTWTLAGDVWTELHPEHFPVARAGAYAFWDPNRERVILFGGSAHGQIDRDTIWSWDGSDWSSSMPASLIVPGRRDAAVAYDSVRDRIVLFGGEVDGSPDVSMADTWEFDGSDWQQMTPDHSPPDRFMARMGYDPVRQIVVMMGGMSEIDGTLSDTWIYQNGDWTEAVNANTPVTSFALQMTWDPVEQKLMLAGEEDVNNLQAWHFDGSTWIAHPESDYDVYGIDEPSLAFDASRGYALYLRDDNQRLQGYAVDSQGVFTHFLPVGEPAGYDADRGALFYDSGAGQMRLFGENLSSSSGFHGWGWDGYMWRYIDVTNPEDPGTPACVAYDAGRDTTVVYDGRIFELSGGSDSWVLRPVTQSPPSDGSMAYDPGRGTIVYFGGVKAFQEYSDETWEWDGSDWQQLSPSTSPLARWQASMAYDAKRQRLVLFGGMGISGGALRYLLDTWEFYDGNWHQVQCDGPDTLRGNSSMCYDAKRQRIMLWAEQDPDEAQVWEYDGNSWQGTPAPPNEDQEGLIGYDPDNQRLLLHLTDGVTWARDSNPADNTDGGTNDDGGSGGDDDKNKSGGCGCTAASAGRPMGIVLLGLLLLAGLVRKSGR